MRSLYHFIRLTRPLNLVVIALTMGVVKVYLDRNEWRTILEGDFLLLVLSTLLVAAAGNMINDYFDVKADRVNKPDQLIIDRHIKRRVAILWNWIFNTAGFLLAFYLSWRSNNWFIVLVSFTAINILWFYSMYFKRTFLLGNIFVAFLTGIVPVYVLVFDPDHSVFESVVIWIFCAYAFWINLIREIVKDMADIKGDLLLRSSTLPIVLGIGKTRMILLLLYLAAIVPLVVWGYVQAGLAVNSGSPAGVMPELTLIASVVIALVLSYLLLPRSFYRARYLLSSNLLKLAMLFGLLTPLFL